MKISKHPSVVGRYLAQIREHRTAQNIMRSAAAARIGMDPTQWTHIEMGRHRSTFDVVAAMAGAVGLRFALVPEDEAPDIERNPVAEVNDVTRLVTSTQRSTVPVETPAQRLAVRLRARREAMGLSQSMVAKMLGRTQARVQNIERSRAEPSYTRMHEYAEVLGAHLDIVEAHHAPLLNLTEGDVARLRGLLRWYLERAPQSPTRAALAQIAAMLDTDTTDQAA